MATSKAKHLYNVSSGTRFMRWALRTTFRQIFHILCNIKVIGKENIPTEGAYIIAHNHISLFEPPFILTFWPIPPEAIGGADIFDRPGQKIMVRAYGTIPIHRGQYDRKVIEIMLDLLKQGKPLLIAPEGSRSHTPGLQRALPGVAYIMDQAKVPVLPVGIVGSTRDLLKRAFRAERPLLEMRIGETFELPPITGKGKTRRQSRQTNADLVMRHIA
ncbi:MAG: 1-acyl-sn-glycerol-3-phosphate acyltransferase, partial [Chloroflexi bacterium]|nr:1-acyl-sn-glycerol-3-phosphate acyltransferase [Chloroflexota bacterium]